MPTTPTYPGVYIEEVPSEVRTITGVATSITAFIGRALKGPTDDPVRVQSFAEFDRNFGGLWRDSMMSYSVQHYFLNGGTDALVVRVVDAAATAAEFDLTGTAGSLKLEAASPGSWGDRLEIFVDHDTEDSEDTKIFNLTIAEVQGDVTKATETFRNLSVDAEHARSVKAWLEHQSDLVRAQDPIPAERPDESPLNPTTNELDPATRSSDGDDGGSIGFGQIGDSSLEADRHGLWALDKADLFNLLCIPPFERNTDTDKDTWVAALKYCRDKRAMLVVDPPSEWTKPDNVQDGKIGIDGEDSTVPASDKNSAVYFPRVRMSDPKWENRLETFAPCGLVAGIFARTDAQRGVWKAPAGQEAVLRGVRELVYKMTDGENGQLNPLGVNCLRKFPVTGHVVWGARTTRGADRLASEWKYVPVRRMALFLEESLYRGTQWVIFEPNDEPLWAQIRLNVGAFMHGLFRQGAFQGQKPSDAYFVKCDHETTTQNDIDKGIVNLLVGFAPLKPAEFLIIKISQIAGQIQT